ncbi:MAG: hypothetical protein SGJ27_31560 [Candidatus Melainabacteria bacterium]|nr:hypothetical protein [Candidatus Melainabacteria bacterium]
MISGRTRVRNKRVGTTIAEAPLALWIIIMAMAFPLLILVMTSVKYGLFWNAARDACKQACQAQTFEQSGPTGSLSAVQTAGSVATAAASSFSGITISNIEVFIIRTDLITGIDQKMPVNLKLANADAPPDPEKYYYAIQVELDGVVEPFIQHPGVANSGLAIPGLTTSFPIRVTSQQPFENIQGLDD